LQDPRVINDIHGESCQPSSFGNAFNDDIHLHGITRSWQGGAQVQRPNRRCRVAGDVGIDRHGMQAIVMGVSVSSAALPKRRHERQADDEGEPDDSYPTH
jgi:hypothetical protein